MHSRYLTRRYVHTIFLSALALGLFYLVRPHMGTILSFLVAVTPLVSWSVGRLYERSIVITSGLADEDELREARAEFRGLF